MSKNAEQTSCSLKEEEPHCELRQTIANTTGKVLNRIQTIKRTNDSQESGESVKFGGLSPIHSISHSWDYDRSFAEMGTFFVKSPGIEDRRAPTKRDIDSFLRNSVKYRLTITTKKENVKSQERVQTVKKPKGVPSTLKKQLNSPVSMHPAIVKRRTKN